MDAEETISMVNYSKIPMDFGYIIFFALIMMK